METYSLADARATLQTVRDCLRYAVSQFNRHELFFGHGSDNAWDEAVYLTLHTLNLPLDRLEQAVEIERLHQKVGGAALRRPAARGRLLGEPEIEKLRQTKIHLPSGGTIMIGCE